MNLTGCCPSIYIQYVNHLNDVVESLKSEEKALEVIVTSKKSKEERMLEFARQTYVNSADSLAVTTTSQGNDSINLTAFISPPQRIL